MIIYGASGHGKVVLDCARACGIEVLGFKDKNPAKVGVFENLPVWPEGKVIEEKRFVMGIGNNVLRSRLSTVLRSESQDLLPQILIHPSAVMAQDVDIGRGSVVFHNATIQTATTIGAHCIVNTSAAVDHDCKVSDFVHVAPNATLCGGVDLGIGVLIGAGATVIPNIRIGNWAVVGAGAVVTKDVPDFATVVGNPAKVIKIGEAQQYE